VMTACNFAFDLTRMVYVSHKLENLVCTSETVRLAPIMDVILSP
jgi:hypothetical protein